MAFSFDYLDELEDFMPAAGNAESYARIVREKGVLRGLHETCVSIVSNIYDSNEGSQVIVDSAETAILKVAEGNYTGNEFTPIKDELEAIFNQIESEVDTGLKTGYPDLDQMVIGLRPSQFLPVRRPGASRPRPLSPLIAPRTVWASVPIGSNSETSLRSFQLQGGSVVTQSIIWPRVELRSRIGASLILHQARAR